MPESFTQFLWFDGWGMMAGSSAVFVVVHCHNMSRDCVWYNNGPESLTQAGMW